MKFLHYLNYFFYIAINWNIKLACFTVYHEIKGENKYKLNTGKLKNVNGLTIKGNNLRNAAMYQGSNYFLLENVFGYLQKENAAKSIVDFGCGRGRALVVAAFFGFNTVTGIEFAQELSVEAEKNIAPLRLRFPEKTFSVIYTDAADYQIENDTNVFFFFNPFNEIVMLAVVKNILRSLKINPREIYTVYINPLHKEIFLSAGFEEIYYYQKLYYAQASILKKSPEEYGAL